MRLRLVGLLLAGASVVTLVQAQNPTGSGNPGAIPGTAGTLGTAQSGRGATQGAPEDSIPVFLSGRVVTADGSPLPESVAIRQVCAIASRIATYTDPKGHFSFQWGQYRDAIPDIAEEGGGFGRFGSAPGASGPTNGRASGMPSGPSLNGCELQAEVPGFRSAPVALDGHGALSSPDVGIIVLHRLEKVEGVSVSITSLKAPPDARKAYDRGLQNLHKGKSADAEREFEKAVGIYPSYANAWLDLGKLRFGQKAMDGAFDAFQKALTADDKLVEARVETGLIEANRSQWAEAARDLDAALKLDPVSYPQAWFIDAASNFNIRKFDVAEQSVREAMKLDYDRKNAETHRLLGLILAARHDYAGAAAELRIYVKSAPDNESVRQQLAQVEKALEQGAR